MSTRDIARAAVRAELGQTAVSLFCDEGFDQVTVNDLAAAAGVSRSTFLRYFASKEDAILSVWETHGNQAADALRARPADEDDWTALRRGLDPIVEQFNRDPAGTLAVARLVNETPALRAHQLERHKCWTPFLAQALAERAGVPEPWPLGLSVKAAAALTCLTLATDHWVASDGQRDLADLLDEAFAALVR